MCARFLRHLLLLCIGRVHGTISGWTVLWEVHPVSAQTKSFISDTDVSIKGSFELYWLSFPIFSIFFF